VGIFQVVDPRDRIRQSHKRESRARANIAELRVAQASVENAMTAIQDSFPSFVSRTAIFKPSFTSLRMLGSGEWNGLRGVLRHTTSAEGFAFSDLQLLPAPSQSLGSQRSGYSCDSDTFDHAPLVSRRTPGNSVNLRSTVSVSGIITTHAMPTMTPASSVGGDYPSYGQ
jgi:hypothetical protein